MASGHDDPVPIGTALDKVLRAIRAGAGRREVGGVFGRWEEAVGAPIAANVRPVRLESGRLLLEVTDPAWATQVHLLADELRARLAETTGVEIREIDVRVQRHPRRPSVPR